MRFLILVLVAAVLGCGERSMPVEPAEEPVEEPVSPSEAARAELDRRGISYDADAFMIAAMAGYLETVKLFVDAGMSVNTVATSDSLRMPVLVGAARFGHLSVVRFLVENGAVVTATGTNGVTALLIAARFGHLEVVRYLVGQGADVNARDNDGYTALLFAGAAGHLEVWDYLVENGAEEPWEPRSTPYNVVSTRVAAGDFLRVKIDPRDVEFGRNFVLSGTFEVTSGGSRDINAYVVDEIGYTNFRNDNNFRALFSAHRITTDRFSVALRSDEAYYFILSNRFSWLTAKTVNADLELRYERLVSVR